MKVWETGGEARWWGGVRIREGRRDGCRRRGEEGGVDKA